MALDQFIPLKTKSLLVIASFCLLSCNSNNRTEVAASDTTVLDTSTINYSESKNSTSNSIIPTETTDYSTLDLSTIKGGNKLYFGEVCEEKCDYIIVEFIGSDEAKLTYNHVWEVNGDSGYFKKEISTGNYKVEYLPQNAIETDNNYWPVYDSVIVLTNTEYGYDNGYINLSKKYAIAKCKSEDSNIIQEPSIYEWLDPVNYPSRNGEFSWSGSKRLTQLQ